MRLCWLGCLDVAMEMVDMATLVMEVRFMEVRGFTGVTAIRMSSLEQRVRMRALLPARLVGVFLSLEPQLDRLQVQARREDKPETRRFRNTRYRLKAWLVCLEVEVLVPWEWEGSDMYAIPRR